MQNKQGKQLKIATQGINQEIFDTAMVKLNEANPLTLTQAEEDYLKNQINLRLAEHYLHRSTYAVYVASPLALFLAYCFYGLVPNINLFGWLACLIISEMSILLGVREYDRNNTTLILAEKIRLKITKLQSVSGFFWGSTTYFLADFNHLLPSVNHLLFASCGIISAFASNVMATSSRALILFNAILGVMMLSYFAIHYDEYSLWFIGALLLFAACFFVGHSNSQQIKEYLRMTVLNEFMADKLAAINLQLRSLASLDALTGVHNRRWMDEQIIQHIAEARRYNLAMSVMLVDIDYFKRINDTHGHEVGDEALADAAKLITQCQRDTDLIARYGGEEFLVLMPMTTLNEASILAERLRSVIEQDSIYPAKYGFKLTVSVGVAQLGLLKNSKNADSPERIMKNLVNNADQALYAAKGAGRNRVELFKSKLAA